MRRQLVIFAKAARLGAVKTRLARDIGALAAWRFYRATLFGLVRRLAGDPRWRTVLAVTPDAAARQPGLWPAGVRRAPQGAGDLGARMERAIRLAPPGPVVIIGSDIPAITRDHVARAFIALERHDVVFGPSDDGGYWLVGARRRPFVPGLFDDVRWSSARALADTRANLGARHRAALIDELCDIDTGADYARRSRPATK